MSLFAQQFNDALSKAMSRSEAASLAGKASAAARKAKAGGGGAESFADASAKANRIIAANPGKYGGAKAKGKGKAGGKGAKSAKDPAAAKAKAAKEAQAAAEHAQAHTEHEQDRAQRQSDRAQRQTEHAQSLKEHESDRAAKQVAQAKHEKQQAQKQKAQAKTKPAPKAETPGAAPKATPAPIAPAAASDAAATLASGTNITPGQRDQLVATGLAKPQKDGKLVLTSTGLKAAQQSTQKAHISGVPSTLLKAFAPVALWHGYATITKVDEALRMVYGDASTETPDAQPGIWKGETYAGDIVSMDAIQAALPDYMQWANLREMHQAVAAGVVTDASVEGSRFPIAAHVTDDQAWRKVTSNTYKGFSIGGQALDAEIVKIEGLPYRRITKLKLTEISLVDRPANPQARITLYKGADMAETDDIATEVADETKLTKAADPTKAIALLQQLRNDAETDGDMDAADEYTAAIRSVAQAAGIATASTDDTDADAPDPADDTGMAMDDAGDGSDDDMAMAIKAGDLRKAFPTYSDNDLIDLLLKRGAAISGNTMGHLKNAHDSLQKATGGAVCAPGQQQQGTGIAMAASLAPDDLAKALAPAFDGLVRLLEKNDVKTDAITKRLDHLEKQPAGGAPVARAVPVEKALPGVEASSVADPKTVELELLKKQRDEATEPAILKWLGDEITKRMIANNYRPLT